MDGNAILVIDKDENNGIILKNLFCRYFAGEF